MSERTESTYIREAVGIFHNKEDLDKAIYDLSQHFPREFLSVLASEETIKEKYDGKTAIDPHDAMNQKSAPRVAPVKPEENVIGTSAIVGGGAYVGAVAGALAAGAISVPVMAGVAIVGALAGGGVGGVLAGVLQTNSADHYEKQINAGGLLLWVGTPDEAKEKQAVSILKKHGATDVEVHDIK